MAVTREGRARGVVVECKWEWEWEWAWVFDCGRRSLEVVGEEEGNVLT
jgi:hypothetical protein